MKNNTITDATVYLDGKHRAWAAALNILATEFYVKTNQPEKYSRYCTLLSTLEDFELDTLDVCMGLNRHITSLGHMFSHGDYEDAKEYLFAFLDEYCKEANK